MIGGDAVDGEARCGGVIEVKQCVCLTEDLTSFSVNPPLALIRVAMKDL